MHKPLLDDTQNNESENEIDNESNTNFLRERVTSDGLGVHLQDNLSFMGRSLSGNWSTIQQNRSACLTNFLVTCYIIQSVSSAVWNIWACYKIHGTESDVMGMSATNYAIWSTGAYLFTNLTSRIPSIKDFRNKLEEKKISVNNSTKNSPTPGNPAFVLSFALNVTTALIKVFSIYVSCIDPEDSILAYESDDAFSEACLILLRHLLAVISVIGAFSGDYTFYYHALANNLARMKDKVIKFCSNSEENTCLEKTSIFFGTFVLSLAGLLGSTNYAIYYLTYFIEGLQVFSEDENLAVAVSGGFVIIIASLRNFFSSYEKMTSFRKIYQIEEDGQYHNPNAFGVLGLVLSLPDIIFLSFNNWTLANKVDGYLQNHADMEGSTLLFVSILTHTASLLYGLQYFAFSIMQGTAKTFNKYGPEKFNGCCTFFKDCCGGKGRHTEKEKYQGEVQELSVSRSRQ